jgi:Septum formation
VPVLPRRVIVPGVQIANETVQDAAAALCRRAFTAFIGGDPATRALSRLTVTYFLPWQGGFDRGAHWVRCDVIALRTEHTLAGLPTRLRGFLNDESALTDYGVCALGRPGSSAAALVSCGHKHHFRAIAALRLGTPSAGYPGTAVTRVDGKRRCRTLVAAHTGKSGGYAFTWTYPTHADWATGQRFGYCWTKTSS